MITSHPRDAPRPRPGLNPLLTTATAISSFQNGTPTPASSSASPFSVLTPGSAIQPYNPQEWISSPVLAQEPSRHYSSDAPVPPEPSPSALPPPPPYSPPQHPASEQALPAPATNPNPSPNPNPSSSAATAITTTATATTPRTPLNRLAPADGMGMSMHSPSFPPPPTLFGRGNSRERRFGLPSLGWARRDHHEQPVPAHDSRSPIAINSTTPASLIGQIPQNHDGGSVGPDASTPTIPPATRRTASASAVETPMSNRSRIAAQTMWNGTRIVLPPPPPGPPPSQARSQSTGGVERVCDPPPTRPRPISLAGAMAGGPLVPPPPPPPPQSRPEPSREITTTRNPQHGRSFATPAAGFAAGNSRGYGENEEPGPALPSRAGSSNLGRSAALRRDPSIVQRRAESRTWQDSDTPVPAGRSRLSDIVVPGPGNYGSRRDPGRAAPGSGGALPSPGQAPSSSRNPCASGSLTAGNSGRAFDARSSTLVSGPLGLGIDANGPATAPLPQTRPASSLQPAKHVVLSQDAEQFCQTAIDRFREFAMREATAANDADRVRVFADFFVGESRIRRERYSSAISAMGSEIFDLTRDLFRPMLPGSEQGSRRSSRGEWTLDAPDHGRPGSHDPTAAAAAAAAAAAPPSHDKAPLRVATSGSGSGPGNASSVSSHLGLSVSSNNINIHRAASTYMPCLSPILSQSVSETLDDRDSRGRPPSRWWERDSLGSPSQRVERSKRESKYMGLPKEQWLEEEDSGPSRTVDEKRPLGLPPDGADQEFVVQPLRLSRGSAPSGSTAPNTPNPHHLDVSRLVNLPPPYPRHHPAVNNNHPELAETRTAVRAVSDLSGVQAIKERFLAKSTATRETFAKDMAEHKQAVRKQLQQNVGAGKMDYAAAAAVEADLQVTERDRTKEMEKTDYAEFQNQVVTPAHQSLTAGIGSATKLFDALTGRLFDPVGHAADMPQEEGDDRPELLEKLTLLKWIFEARESLHRAVYDLLTDRNNRYRDVILTPYRLSGNAEKAAAAEAFFADDNRKRELEFFQESLGRARQFLRVVEQTVVKGVEVQLSAFWDIAPSLSEILDRIPQDLSIFNVQIPPAEIDENPGYRSHPLQYLYSLLLHAEKSTYQLIESQTNLLCLLHEVKEMVTNAKVKVWERAGGSGEEPGTEGAAHSVAEDEDKASRARSLQREEKMHLMADLKEKVREVQGQWQSALGDNVGGVKQRVGGWLLETGGWDESLEEDGVGMGLI